MLFCFWWYTGIMKGEATLRILKAIEGRPHTMGDLLAAIFEAGYGASYRRILNVAGKHTAAREVSQRYHNLIYKLKRDGLVEERTSGTEKILTLSEKGKAKLEALKNRGKLPDVKGYKKEEAATFVIVSFDVPERDRKKRDWLRAVLKNLELRMIQKSVWVGKTKLPIAFLDDLHKLHLLDYVQIFQISKSGTLTEL